MHIGRTLITLKSGALAISNWKSGGKERLTYEGLFNLLKLRKLGLLWFSFVCFFCLKDEDQILEVWAWHLKASLFISHVHVRKCAMKTKVIFMWWQVQVPTAIPNLLGIFNTLPLFAVHAYNAVCESWSGFPWNKNNAF